MRKLLWTLLLAYLSCAASTMAIASGRVALSFDDGPDVRFTPILLDILKEEGVTATFCLVGRRVRDAPAIARRIAEEGHELCNHSWSHPVLTRTNIAAQIGQTDAAILAATGTTPTILRAPYGATGSVGSCYDGRPFVGWGAHGDTLDWRYRDMGRITRVAAATPADEIVLMHDIHPTTVASVRAIITRLKARGMTFVRASALWKHPCGSLAGHV